MSLPQDVLEFVKECERRGMPPKAVALMKGGFPRERYDVLVRDAEGWRYVGEVGSEEAFKEPFEVVCGKLTCALFWRDSIVLAYDRVERRVYEPEEV